MKVQCATHIAAGAVNCLADTIVNGTALCAYCATHAVNGVALSSIATTVGKMLKL